MTNKTDIDQLIQYLEKQIEVTEMAQDQFCSDEEVCENQGYVTALVDVIEHLESLKTNE